MDEGFVTGSSAKRLIFSLLRKLGRPVPLSRSSVETLDVRVSPAGAERREVMMMRDRCKMRDGSSVKVDQVEGVGFPYSKRAEIGSRLSVNASRQIG
ncbi:hypothetical protein Baya_15860 [Bagarius yarrelli]|uniref:Uncharacterized protein n=1 Tax=Bagarius yarrelli TaxID=175774 RepID=A0A556VTU0_BAGYA|nr:hypothetical protein Baya_15860 [Bagarius yarrelli]